MIVYTMTRVGVSFRTWFLEKKNRAGGGAKALIPFHGESNDWRLVAIYLPIDVDLVNAWILPWRISMVKEPGIADDQS